MPSEDLSNEDLTHDYSGSSSFGYGDYSKDDPSMQASGKLSHTHAKADVCFDICAN